MNKVPDRAKMRWEYLEDKTAATVQKIVGLVITGCCILAGLLSALPTLFSVIMWLLFRDVDFPTDTGDWLFVRLPIFSLFALSGFLMFHTATQWEKSVSYVAPIHEQIPTLPAEEVLLRGSQASAASPEELLRAAGSQETPADELLRGADNRGS